MRSLAETIRVGAERVIRVLVIGTLAWYLVHVIRDRRVGGDERADSPELGAALRRWTTVASPSRIHVELTRPPTGDERDWLAALAGASTSVTWSGPSLLPTAIEDDPRADPRRGFDISIAAPSGTMVVLSDTLGVLDSARATASGVHAYVPGSHPTVDARAGAVVARGAARDSLRLKRLLVIGSASWETKFTVAALEERGWAVDPEIALAPQRTVRPGVGAIATIDTARYAAVIAIDTAATPFAGRIAAFVRNGGGLVLWSQATTGRAFSAIAPGGAGQPVDDELAIPADSAPRQALALTPIVSITPDAVVLEHRGTLVSLAARRVGIGRVIETGYTNAWRWRMAGGREAPDRHREWLAGLVSAVADAGRAPIAAPPTDVAPVASMIDRLGPALPASSTTGPPGQLARWVFVALCVALVLEWLSRRMRGHK